MLQEYDITNFAEMQEGAVYDPMPGLGERKMNNIALAEAAERAGYAPEAERLRSCGLAPVTAVNKITGETGFAGFYHCRVRLCPICEWGRARANYARLSAALGWIKEKEPGLVPCFLTLTLKNVPPDKLRFTISHMLQSFHRLLRQREVKRCVRGYWRALEVTRNAKEATYHPHIHVLLMMTPGYASKNGAYIEHTEWVKRWKMALDVVYPPSVYIERVGYGEKAEEEHKAVLEVTKYAVKGSDILTGSKALQARIFGQLRPALAGLRLVGAGGIIKDALKLLKLGELEDPNSPEDESIMRRVEANPADWILLHWRWGASGYILDGRKDGAEDA